APFLNVNGPISVTRQISFNTDSVPRWRMGISAGGETGVNDAGAGFILNAFDDAGGALGSPFPINRGSRLITVAGDPTANLGIATKQYVDAHAGAVTDNVSIVGDGAVGGTPLSVALINCGTY